MLHRMSLSDETKRALSTLPLEVRAELANELILARNVLDLSSHWRAPQASEQIAEVIRLLKRFP